MVRTRSTSGGGRRRPSVLDIAPAVALFTVMSVPWLTTQAHEAKDAQIVPFELAAHPSNSPPLGAPTSDVVLFPRPLRVAPR